MKRRIAFGLTTGGLLAGGGLGFAHADSTGTGSGTTGTTAGGSPGILSGNTIQVPVDIPINVCGVTANVVGLLNPAAHNGCANEGGATATGGSGSTNSDGSTSGSTANGGAQGSPGILSGNNVQIPVNVPVNVCGDTLSVVAVGDAAKGNHCSNGGGATATGGSGSTATGGAQGSPGILSGNNVQIPVNVPVNVCGESVSVVGIGDAAKGNHCHAGGGAVVPPPPLSSTPPSTAPPSNPVTPGGPIDSHPGGSTGGSGGNGSQPDTSTGALAHTGADGLMLAPVGAAMIGGGAFLYRKFKPRGKQ